MNSKISALCKKRDLLVIFRGLAQDEVFHRLMILLGSDSRHLSSFLADYSDFVSELYNRDTVDLSHYLLSIALSDDNFCSRLINNGEELPEEIKECLTHELKFLEEISQLIPEDFAGAIDYSGYLPRWNVTKIDFVASYKSHMGIE